MIPQSVSRGGRISGLPGSLICYGLPGCSTPCTDLTGFPANGAFYIQAFSGSVALPAAGYNYNSDWTPLLVGLSPTGMAASLAAPVLRYPSARHLRLRSACALVEGFLAGRVICRIDDIHDLRRDPAHHDLEPLSQGHLRSRAALASAAHGDE